MLLVLITEVNVIRCEAIPLALTVCLLVVVICRCFMVGAEGNDIAIIVGVVGRWGRTCVWKKGMRRGL